MTHPLPPTPVLETERLTLRPLEARDAPAIQRLFPQWEVVQHLHAGIPWPYPEDAAATNTIQCIEDRAKGLRIYWTITLKGSDDLRGRIDLWAYDPERRDSRGFWLDPLLHGQGLMTEAVGLVTAYAFDTLSLHRVHAAFLPGNVASRRVLEKNGFREEGYAENYLQIDGKWADHVLFGLTRERYETVIKQIGR